MHRGRRARRARALPAAHALRPDHPRRRREPRDGDGARHRRAHARSRSSSRSAASPPRSPACSPTSTSAPSTRSAARRLLIFAFIVVVIGGLGSLARHGVAAVVVGLVAAVRELLRVVRPRRPLASCCCSALVLLVRPRGLSRELRMSRVRASRPSRSSLLVVLALVPKLAVDIPYLFNEHAQHAGHAAAARAAASSSAGSR